MRAEASMIGKELLYAHVDLPKRVLSIITVALGEEGFLWNEHSTPVADSDVVQYFGSGALLS